MKVIINILGLVLLSHVSHAYLTCPPFWNLYKEHCYRFFGDRLSWTEAENECNKHFTERGMARLTSIHHADENIFVYKLFRMSVGKTPDWIEAPGDDAYGVWLGLHQENVLDPWIYTDNTAVSYSNWEPSGEPDTLYYGQLATCSAIWRKNDADDKIYGWSDFPCSKEMTYVCKVAADRK